MSGDLSVSPSNELPVREPVEARVSECTGGGKKGNTFLITKDLSHDTPSYL